MEPGMKSVKIALYLSIFLWFLRKLLMKLRGNYKSFRGSIRKHPGQAGYDLAFDTCFQMELGMVMSVDHVNTGPLLYRVKGGPYDICRRDADRIMADKRFPRYTRNINGLRLKLIFLSAGHFDEEIRKSMTVPDCLKGTWMFDEAKSLCDEGIAFMDRLFK